MRNTNKAKQIVITVAMTLTNYGSHDPHLIGILELYVNNCISITVVDSLFNETRNKNCCNYSIVMQNQVLKNVKWCIFNDQFRVPVRLSIY